VRTVTGPTDHVVVVGAGLAGLSTAMRLAGAGRRVTVLEREPVPGGRAGLLELAAPDGRGTYRFDTGPTVLTMPSLIEDCFASLGECMADWLELLPVEPVYRGEFADGSHIDVHADREAMAEEVARVCGSAEARGYRRYVHALSRLYRYEVRDFIDRNLDSPVALLTPNLARLAAAGGFRRLAPFVARYLRDPRLQRLFSFQAMYAGVSPQQALALYAVISYMDAVAGVVLPRGGMHALPRALAAAADRHGVELRYGTTVTGLERRAGRVRAVTTADGDRVAADVVVLSPDLPVVYRDLLGGQPWSVRRLRYSPSCFLLLAGVRDDDGDAAHHTLSFGDAWEGTFDDLLSGRLMRDPSLLLSRPTATDPSLAPPGRGIRYVLAPVPHLRVASTPLNWERLAPRYRDHVLGTLAARGHDVGPIEVEHVTTPLGWRARGMEAGTPFAAAHTFRQTGPFRPGNLPGRLVGENVVLTGSGTQPGVGVPMVLVSGRLAAERVVGPGAVRRSTW
jgi:phytoene desaturase